jgi:integrase
MGSHISQRSVKSAKAPAEGSCISYDDQVRGFGLRVTAAGIKSFVLNYSIAGRERRITIGRWPEWTADAARTEALKLRENISKGTDPLREREYARGEPLVADLAAKYIDEYALAHKRDRSVYYDRRMLDGIILPKLGRLRVSAVDKIDIQRLHISLKKTPYQANRVLSLLKKIFACAVDWNMHGDNPARAVKRFHEDKREAWLSREQLQSLSDALDAYPKQDAADAIRLLVLTGARPDEVIGAEWAMFDLQRGIWNKPSHHVKQKKDEHPPLSIAALTILRRMAEFRTGIHLFPGRDLAAGRSRTTLRNTWRQVCKTAGLATEYYVKGKRGKLLSRWRPNVRLYDLRHTFASHLVSRGASLYLVGKLLGHTQASTTQRYAHVADGALRNIANDFSEVLASQKQSKTAKKSAKPKKADLAGRAPALLEAVTAAL